MKSSTKILFTYLVAFGKTGGLEKVNRTILKCLNDNLEGRFASDSWSLYDDEVGSDYFDKSRFLGFGGARIKFVIQLLKNNRSWNKIIIGHINLAFVARILKFLNPRQKLILIVHGIEVWESVSGSKKWLLQNANRIISVSNYTKKMIVEKHHIIESKITVLHNCLDPYFPKEFKQEKPTNLLKRYNISDDKKLILTITRINENENRKGYDLVIKVLSAISNNYPKLEFQYILCGKYSDTEYRRLMLLIEENKLLDKVILPGFIDDTELVDHYRISDIYIMPSKKEGFGMVYIEAAACGVKVVAGNADGSAEALMNGEIGYLVNPDSFEEIYNKLLELLQAPMLKSKEVSEKAYEHYDFDKYKQNLLAIIEAV